MDRMNDNNATPKKDTGAKGMSHDNQMSDEVKERDSEIEQPNPSIAIPAIPDEMPVREAR